MHSTFHRLLWFPSMLSVRMTHTSHLLDFNSIAYISKNGPGFAQRFGIKVCPFFLGLRCHTLIFCYITVQSNLKQVIGAYRFKNWL
jgi:hypothetical protein